MLEIANLEFAWKSGHTLLNIPALKIEQGEKVFVKGPSGSGKSTLLGLIGGVYQPVRGCIRILNTDITALTQARRDQFRADHVGFVFQMFNLLPYLSVLDNVALACQFSPRRAARVKQLYPQSNKPVYTAAQTLLQRLGLTEPALWARAVTELSVGQQQRVAVARALMGQPELIIADEPTSALDADTRDEFIRLLQNETQFSGSSLIFVSHDSHLQSHFDRSLLLNELNLASPKATSHE